MSVERDPLEGLANADVRGPATQLSLTLSESDLGDEGVVELPPVSAAQIDDMIVMLHWLMLVLFVGWSIFFIYTLIRFRASAHPKADYVGVKSHTTSSYLDVAVVIVEAVILLGFAIPAWAVRVNAVPPEDGATVIHVIAKQFEWHTVYPGPDGRFGRRDASLITSTNAIGLDRSDPNGADDIHTINQILFGSFDITFSGC